MSSEVASKLAARHDCPYVRHKTMSEPVIIPNFCRALIKLRSLEAETENVSPDLQVKYWLKSLYISEKQLDSVEHIHKYVKCIVL